MKRALIPLSLLLAGCGVQPTDVITGTPATGAVIYMVQADTPVPVVRMTGHQLSALEVLSLLTTTLTAAERDHGLTNEVPVTADPVDLGRNEITLQIDPNSLSALAVAQIVCTAAIPGPVTLVGGGQSRGPATCPV